MRIHTYLALLTCMIVAGSCRTNDRTPSEPRWSPASRADCAESATELLTIEEFSLTCENLVLTYRVTNTLPRDIWICTSQNVLFDTENGRYIDGEDSLYGRDVLIVDRQLRIQRRANVEQNVFIYGDGYAVYRRLLPGQIRSSRIVLPCPVEPFSSVYSRSGKFAELVLDCIVVQVGYFDEDLPSLVQKYSVQGEPKTYAVLREGLKWYAIDPNMIWIPYLDKHRWDGLLLEKTASATISNVAIPAVVGVDLTGMTGGNGDSHE